MCSKFVDIELRGSDYRIHYYVSWTDSLPFKRKTIVHTFSTILKPDVAARGVYCSDLPPRGTHRECSWLTDVRGHDFGSITTSHTGRVLLGLLPASDCVWQKERSIVLSEK